MPRGGKGWGGVCGIKQGGGNRQSNCHLGKSIPGRRNSKGHKARAGLSGLNSKDSGALSSWKRKEKEVRDVMQTEPCRP